MTGITCSQGLLSSEDRSTQTTGLDQICIYICSWDQILDKKQLKGEGWILGHIWVHYTREGMAAGPWGLLFRSVQTRAARGELLIGWLSPWFLFSPRPHAMGCTILSTVCRKLSSLCYLFLELSPQIHPKMWLPGVLGSSWCIQVESQRSTTTYGPMLSLQRR